LIKETGLRLVLGNTTPGDPWVQNTVVSTMVSSYFVEDSYLEGPWFGGLAAEHSAAGPGSGGGLPGCGGLRAPGDRGFVRAGG